MPSARAMARDMASAAQQRAQWTTRPSDIMGLASVVSLLPMGQLREELSSLSDRQVRKVVLDVARTRQRTAARVRARYDKVFAPRADALLAFDAVVAAIETTLEPLVQQQQQQASLSTSQTDRYSVGGGGGGDGGDGGAEDEGDMALRNTLNKRVAVHIRSIHAAALPPASLGTRTNALKALLDLNRFLITRGMLFTERQRDIFNSGPIGPAFLDMVASLGVQEKPIVLATLVNEKSLAAELTAQVHVFERHCVFPEIVEARGLLNEASVPVQAALVVMVDEGMEDSQASAADRESLHELDDLGTETPADKAVLPSEGTR